MVLNPLDPIGRKCLRIIASATRKIVGEGALYDRLRRAAGTGSSQDYEEAAKSFNRLTGNQRRSIGDEAEIRAFELRSKEGAIDAPGDTATSGSAGSKATIIEPPKIAAGKGGRKKISFSDGWFVRS